MFKILLFLSFALLCKLAVGNQVGPRMINNKINIAVYFESKCPDSKRFVNNQIHRALAEFPDLVNFIMIPFGKANYTWLSTSNSWFFQCQHGPEECYGNQIHGCLIYYRPNFNDHFPFINCTMENIIESRRDRAIACNQIYQLPEFNDVMSCADGALGNQIKYANGIWTYALIPPLFYVPWITFDNVYSNDLRVAAEQDIVKAICSQLSGPNLPSPCNSAFSNTSFSLLTLIICWLFIELNKI